MIIFTLALFRACLHGGGGPHISEVTRLAGDWGDHVRVMTWMFHFRELFVLS